MSREKARRRNKTGHLWRLLGSFILIYLAATLSAAMGTFPYPYIRDAGRTLDALMTEWAIRHTPVWNVVAGTSGIPAGEASRSRWLAVDKTAPGRPVLVAGGVQHFLDLCPENGCLAVSYDADRQVIHAWPYRPRDIFADDITHGAYPHEHVVFDPEINVFPVGVLTYPNGDLLVNFQMNAGGIFPYGMGVARIKPDGYPRWTRFDYSHHWSYLGTDGIAYVPALRVGKRNLRFKVGGPSVNEKVVLPCKTGRPQMDVVEKIDGNGRLLETIDLVPLLLRSNWAGLLETTADFCDPLHLNFVDVVGSDAGPGLTPGDIVVSLHNLSRFAIIDAKTHQIKKMISGSFVQQHSVQYLTGSKFLVFDNLGGGDLGPPSRILEVDISTGQERRVFPRSDTPEAYRRLFSRWYGHLAISPDRRRVFASFTYTGRSMEIDLETGRLIAVYDNLHDVSSVPGADAQQKSNAVRFWTLSMSYLPP